ncbi:MAG: SpoVR family protein [Proteobacteria bacterium]|nr:SpoVR family protein [Pseudomonadota bacterium]
MDPRLTSELTPELKNIVREIESQCKNLGLDFFPVIFEMVDYQQMSEIAAYGGFPTRYPHWRFGMEYEHLSKSYEYGLSLIYEMVINNDPCYAYLLKSNSLVDQKTVIAHVYGHCDFFKNNYCFQHTNRKMLDEMANHGSRVRRYIEEVGQDEVESFIDTCLTLENLIDQHAPHIRREPKLSRDPDDLLPPEKRPVPKLPTQRSYMDGYINPESYLKEQQERIVREFEREKRFPETPRRDVLQFLIEHAPLSSWQRDVLSIVREEAYYFAPQGQTKIMNEGWAVYWHSKLMTEFVLNDSEVIDYCDHYAGVTATSGMRLNPYKVGVELMRHIENRWNKGKFGLDYMLCDDPAVRKAWNTNTNRGREKLFEVRKFHNDITFIDEFLDEDFCEEAKMFTWAADRRSGQAVIHDRDFPAIKKELLDALTNFGQPVIEVVDGNFQNRGELLLTHKHQGKDLKVDWAMETMSSLYKIWNRPVNLATVLEGEARLLVYDGGEPRIEKAPALDAEAAAAGA